MYRSKLNNGGSLIILVLLLTCTLSTLPGRAMDMDVEAGKCLAEESYHRTVDAAGLKKVSLETFNGSIGVSGYDGKTIIIDATIKVRGEEQDICDEILGKTALRLKEDGKILHIEPEFNKKKKGYSISVSFDLQVPERMDIHGETINGGIKVRKITGNGRFETINGGIECISVSGDIEAETINGGIELAEIPGDVEASTVNGSISYNSSDVAPTDLELSTINGKISVMLGRIPDAELEISAMNGSIKVEGLHNLELKKKSRSFSSTLGSGKGDYEFSTINGSVELKIKEAD